MLLVVLPSGVMPLQRLAWPFVDPPPPPRIDNPDYKGKWVAPEIDNPAYKHDDTLYQYKDLK